MINLFFGRYFWVWICGFLMCSSYLGARSVSQLTRLWMPTLPYSPPQSSTFGSQIEKKRANVILNNYNLLDPSNAPVKKVEKKIETKVEKKTEKSLAKTDKYGCPIPSKDEKIKRTRLRIKLKGTTYVASAPSWSTAAIYSKFKLPPPKFKIKGKRSYKKTLRRAEIFRVGEKIKGATICSISRRSIILHNNNRLERLSLNRKKKGKKTFMYGAVGMILDQDKGDEQIKPQSTDKFTIKRSIVQDWLANPMKHAMSARIMPHYKRGRAAGFRLIWVRKGSLYSKLGLKSGDVVQQINGKNVSVGTALGLYSKLPYARSVRVNVIRKGAPKQLMYNIK